VWKYNQYKVKVLNKDSSPLAFAVLAMRVSVMLATALLELGCVFEFP
jgi:hypothetical protein